MAVSLLHDLDLDGNTKTTAIGAPTFRRTELVIYRRRPKLEFLQAIPLQSMLNSVSFACCANHFLVTVSVSLLCFVPGMWFIIFSVSWVQLASAL